MGMKIFVNTTSSHTHTVSIDMNFLTSTEKKKTDSFFIVEPTDDDDDEIQFKPTTIDPLTSTRSTIMSNSIELQRLTTSVETMRASILQAYVVLKSFFFFFSSIYFHILKIFGFT
jgi:hypothetical protein